MAKIDEARAALDAARPEFDAITAVADELCLERLRQIEKEGFSTDHDDEYGSAELPRAAMAYCQAAFIDDASFTARRAPFYWPWDAKRWKPTNRRRDLVKAGALIIAEIQRIDREKA